MKNIIFTIVFIGLLGLNFTAKAEKIKWVTMNEAIELTKTNPKKIFIDIYTSWCGWCVRMDTSTFENPAVVRYMNQNFYCVKFNAEGKEVVNFGGKSYTNPSTGRRSTHPFAAILLQNQMTYPSFVILDEKLRGVAAIKGYKKAGNFYPLLKYFHTDAYKNETLEEFKARIKKEETE